MPTYCENFHKSTKKFFYEKLKHNTFNNDKHKVISQKSKYYLRKS